ncbi:hypothetical protein CANCADRAFT_16130, partial [Tortispora caseinolytica NRRL Y-17796]
DLALLACDHVGNMIVQKLYECGDAHLRSTILQMLLPYLAYMGVHKNGTWAAQKIISLSSNPTDLTMISQALRPYIVPLLLDQYGNYVIQGCLRFGSPFIDFISEAIMSEFLVVCRSRFGSRAVRACLESSYISEPLETAIAATIAEYVCPLSVNANGSLLLTWYVETCQLPNRCLLLAEKALPGLVAICCHRFAPNAILKALQFAKEPEARYIFLKALFDSENTKNLEEILSDPVHGPALVYKVITMPVIDRKSQVDACEVVLRVLNKMRVLRSEAYRKLVDEL